MKVLKIGKTYPKKVEQLLLRLNFSTEKAESLVKKPLKFINISINHMSTKDQKAFLAQVNIICKQVQLPDDEISVEDFNIFELPNRYDYIATNKIEALPVKHVVVIPEDDWKAVMETISTYEKKCRNMHIAKDLIGTLCTLEDKIEEIRGLVQTYIN